MNRSFKLFSTLKQKKKQRDLSAAQINKSWISSTKRFTLKSLVNSVNKKEIEIKGKKIILNKTRVNSHTHSIIIIRMGKWLKNKRNIYLAAAIETKTRYKRRNEQNEENKKKDEKKKLSNIIFYERPFQQQFIVLLELQLLLYCLLLWMLQYEYIHLLVSPFSFSIQFSLIFSSIWSFLYTIIIAYNKCFEFVWIGMSWIEFLWWFLFNVTTASTDRL